MFTRPLFLVAVIALGCVAKGQDQDIYNVTFTSYNDTSCTPWTQLGPPIVQTIENYKCVPEGFTYQFVGIRDDFLYAELQCRDMWCSRNCSKVTLFKGKCGRSCFTVGGRQFCIGLIATWGTPPPPPPPPSGEYEITSTLYSTTSCAWGTNLTAPQTVRVQNDECIDISVPGYVNFMSFRIDGSVLYGKMFCNESTCRKGCSNFSTYQGVCASFYVHVDGYTIALNDIFTWRQISANLLPWQKPAVKTNAVVQKFASRALVYQWLPHIAAAIKRKKAERSEHSHE